MSFITQGFIGGRACADMLYSGHITMLTLMVMTGAATYRPGESKLMFWLFSIALIVVGGGFLVQCQDHYTADVVLGFGIAVLLFEYPPLRRMGTQWAQWNYAAERRLIGDTADAKKSN